MSNIIEQAQEELAKAQREIADLERQLHALKGQRTERPADSAAWASWEAGSNSLERQIAQLDLDIRLVRGRLVELRGHVQAARGRVYRARIDATSARARLDQHAKRIAEARAKLAQLEAERDGLEQAVEERQRAVAELLGVGEGELDDALEALDRPAEAYQMSWERAAEPAPPSPAVPPRVERGVGMLPRYFDQHNRETDASGGPLR